MLPEMNESGLDEKNPESKESGEGDNNDEYSFLDDSEPKKNLLYEDSDQICFLNYGPETEENPKIYSDIELIRKRLSGNSRKISTQKSTMMYSEITRLTSNYRLQRRAKHFLRGAVEGLVIDLLTTVEQDGILKKGKKRIKVDEKVVRETIFHDHEFSSVVPLDEIRRKIPRTRSPVNVHQIDRILNPQ